MKDDMNWEDREEYYSDLKKRIERGYVKMDDELEEFEDEQSGYNKDTDEDDELDLNNLRNGKKKKVIPQKQPQPQPRREETPQKREITMSEVVTVLQNQDQRITTLEAALFRLKGSI